jgi:hypothetical protein
LIYAVIVAAWAVILVPRWLARHDERAPVIIESRPEDVAQAAEDRATSTARLLDRRARPQVPIPRPMPHRTGRRHQQRAAGVRPPHAGRRDPAGRTRPGRPASSPVMIPSSVQVRRRRILFLLAGTSVALGVAGGLVRVPLWVAGAALAVLIGYVGRLRSEVRRAQRRDRRRQLLARQAAARRHAVRAARRRFPTRRRAETPGRPVLINPDGTWNPIPLPLPTYITAPVVDRPAARVIDVSATGMAWTSGRFRPEPIQPEPIQPELVPLAEATLAESAGSGVDDQDFPFDEREAVNG